MNNISSNTKNRLNYYSLFFVLNKVASSVLKGGFDRTNLFQQAEKGFDKLFDYNRPLSESFEYFNAMKNGSITEQISLEEKILVHEKESLQTGLHAEVQINKKAKIRF